MDNLKKYFLENVERFTSLSGVTNVRAMAWDYCNKNNCYQDERKVEKYFFDLFKQKI